MRPVPPMMTIFMSVSLEVMSAEWHLEMAAVVEQGLS
jgi:hypothetical protein